MNIFFWRSGFLKRGFKKNEVEGNRLAIVFDLLKLTMSSSVIAIKWSTDLALKRTANFVPPIDSISSECSLSLNPRLTIAT